MNQEAIDFYLDLLRYEQIEIVTEGVITDKIKKAYEHVKKRLQKATKTFKKYGVSLTEIGKKGANKFKNHMWKLFKQGLSPMKAGPKLVGDMVKFIIPYLKPMAKKLMELNKTAKWLLAVLAAAGIIALVVVLNTSAIALLTRVGFSNFDAMIIAALAVAPIVEEAMKTFFIKLGVPWVGTTLFVVGENIVQGIMMAKNVGGWPMFLLLRTGTNIFHFLTTKLQLDNKTESERKDPDGSELKKMFKMWSVAAIVHALVNGIVLYKSWDMYRGIFDKSSLSWWVNAFTGKAVVI